MKECNRCGESKDLTKFYFRKDRQVYNGICKCCSTKQQRDARDPEQKKAYHRDWHLKKTYGITLEQSDTLLEAQGGCCDICGVEEKHAQFGRLCVDHDHDTLEVRALLCSPCNTGIGMFKENQDFLANAITYLKRFKT